MTQHLGAPPIGGGEGCSLRAAADWLRGEAARRPQKLSKHRLLPARIPIVAGTSGPTLPAPGSWEAAGSGRRPGGRGEEGSGGLRRRDAPGGGRRDGCGREPRGAPRPAPAPPPSPPRPRGRPGSRARRCAHGGESEDRTGVRPARPGGSRRGADLADEKGEDAVQSLFRRRQGVGPPRSEQLVLGLSAALDGLAAGGGWRLRGGRSPIPAAVFLGSCCPGLACLAQL